jgi:PKD repeat protein
VFSEQVYAQTANSIVIDNGAPYTNSTRLELTLSSINASQMRFSSDNSSWSDWEAFATARNYTATEGDKNYTIYVEFQDSENQTSTVNASIVVDTTLPEPVPYADWYTTDYRTVYFDASYSTDNFGIANYTWDFGDGNVTNGMTVIHTYEDIGNYTVTLSVLDYAGNNGSVTLLARIPDLTSTATPTPTPVPTTYIPPTTYPTTNPTASPTPLASIFDSTWTFAIVGVLIIVIFGAVIILLLRKSSKNQVPTAP